MKGLAQCILLAERRPGFRRSPSPSRFPPARTSWETAGAGRAPEARPAARWREGCTVRVASWKGAPVGTPRSLPIRHHAPPAACAPTACAPTIRIDKNEVAGNERGARRSPTSMSTEPTPLTMPAVAGPAPLPLGRRRDPRRRHLLVAAQPGAVLGRHPRRRLHRYDAGRRRARELGTSTRRSPPSPSAPTAPGLIVTLRRGFALLRPGHGRRAALPAPARAPSRAGNRFNDGKCDAHGRFWGGTMDFACEAPTGALYRYDPDGRCTRARHWASPSPTARPGRSTAARCTSTTRCAAASMPTTSTRTAGTLSNKREWLRFAPRRRPARRHDHRCRRPRSGSRTGAAPASPATTR